MKFIIPSIIISAVFAVSVGYYFGISSKERDIDFTYCSIYKVYTDGIIYSLKSLDIESSPEATLRLVSELKTINGEIERCLGMGLDVQQQLEATNSEANERLRSL